ncbi:lipase/acyltransferase domain-containing protein [Actinomadura scrupuli]|uniref:lipase/acyltransferase domain-containing protein n=1 Tax=Actinomadura scrupuli TaxID=559629 RepID=UPI003D973378
MRSARRPFCLPAAAILSSAVIGVTAAGITPAGAASPTRAAAATLRPIVFVHGFFGSGSQWETQAKRFAGNGYPADRIESQEYDSLFLNNTSDQVFTQLDQRIARLKARTGADQVDLVGHSLGTTMSQDYLKSSASRAANVAHYVNIDGATATSPPGGVPTLAIWGEGDQTRSITGATNVYSPNESHVQTTSSEATFTAAYTFLTGKAPATTEVVPQFGQIQLAGRAVSFPSNVGVRNGRLDVYTVDSATGRRTGAAPVASQPLSGDGSFGPFPASGTASYEFAISHNGSPQVHHQYFQPFRRTDLGIRLLSTDPGTGVDLLIEHDRRHVALSIYRNKEWWGDQGAGNDTLTVNGTGILNSTITPRAKRAIDIMAFDARSDGVSHVTTTPGLLGGLPFITGVDLYVPAGPDGTVTLESRQRGGDGGTARLATPNWPSDTHVVTATFDDYS